jgi:hypothetical protein
MDISADWEVSRSASPRVDTTATDIARASLLISLSREGRFTPILARSVRHKADFQAVDKTTAAHDRQTQRGVAGRPSVSGQAWEDLLSDPLNARLESGMTLR